MSEVKLTDPFIGIVYQLVEKELKNKEARIIDLYNLNHNSKDFEQITLGELYFLKIILQDSLNKY
jgi:hypothetical protein